MTQAEPRVTLVTSKDDDPTVLENAVREATGAALAGEDRTLALEELTGDELTLGSVVDACQTPPFLASRRVVLVRDVGRWSSEELEPLMVYLADPLSTTWLILVAGGGRLSQRLVNAAKKHGVVIDATVPTGKARVGWLAEQLRGAPVTLDDKAALALGAHLGEDVGRLAGLLEALAASYGEGAAIGAEELEPFLGLAGGVPPWDLTDAIDRGDTEAALVALSRMMGGGDRHALAILAVLHRHFSAMLRLDGSGARTEGEAAGLVGMAPFQAAKALRAAQRLGSLGVARAIALLAEADLDLRGMKEWSDELVMEVLVARLSRLGGRTPARAGRR